MSADLIPFSYEGYQVRAIQIDGEPWFVAADVARFLGYRDASNAVRRLRESQKGTHLASTPGGDQRVSVVSEGGLYRLIMRSNVEAAEDFQDWVTDVVLPAIRKTGRYEVQPQQHEIPQTLADALEFAAKRVREVEALAKRNAELAPMAAEAEHHRAASGLKAVGDFANDLKAWAKTNYPDVKVRHQDVWDHLARLGLVIRGDTIRHNQPTAKAVENGYCVPKVSDFDRPEGPGTSTTTRLTPKGEGYVFDRLTAYVEANGTLQLPRQIGGAA